MAIAETRPAPDPTTSRDPIAALSQHVIDARKDIAALKAVVATQDHLQEMETRITEHLDGIDGKIDRLTEAVNAIAEHTLGRPLGLV